MRSHENRVPGLTRRRVLGGAGLLAAMPLAGCDLLSTGPSGQDGSGNESGTAIKGKEAPALAQRVEAGDLPPVEERLPANPTVIQPVESVGTYGGEWNTTIMSAGADAYEYIGYDPLVRWDPGFTEIIPGLAEWEVTDDGRSYTFRLLDGLRWSDGEPFTSDDIVFVYDDVLSNAELFPDFPTWLVVEGEPGTIEKVDDTSFTLSFVEPNGLLLGELATPDGAILTTLPRHHFEQFHKEYNSDVDAEAQQEGFDSWTELFTARGGLGSTDLGYWQSPEIPTVTPWVVTRGLGGGGTQRIVCERNPYYWKTDPEGHQLPYIDRVNIHLVENPETLVLQASEGRYSLPSQDVETPDNKTVLARNRKAGGYHFIDLKTSDTNYTTVSFNQTCKNPSLREVFQNKDFRIGLSHAINRPEMAQVVYRQQGEPWQVAPLPGGPFHDEELGTQYTEFDLNLAEEHLDRAGFTQRDGDGFRLGPDGNRISFQCVSPEYDPTWPGMADLITTYWKEVGIEMKYQLIANSLFFDRAGANDIDVAIYSGEAGLLDALYFPRWYFPYDGVSIFALQWSRWYVTEGQEGEEPPSGPMQQMELYDEILRTAEFERQQELFRQLLTITSDEFYVIGTVRPTNKYAVVQSPMKNVMNNMPEAGIYPDPAPSRPEQYFLTS